VPRCQQYNEWLYYELIAKACELLYPWTLRERQREPFALFGSRWSALTSEGVTLEGGRGLPPIRWERQPLAYPSHLTALTRGVRYHSDRIGGLAEPPAPAPRRSSKPASARADDPLLNIAPSVDVEALTGRPVGRDRKISCPLHPDRAYGGDIYDLAAQTSGLSIRGRDFPELRRLAAEHADARNAARAHVGPV
jgi:hypothetical protein